MLELHWEILIRTQRLEKRGTLRLDASVRPPIHCACDTIARLTASYHKSWNRTGLSPRSARSNAIFAYRVWSAPWSKHQAAYDQSWSGHQHVPLEFAAPQSILVEGAYSSILPNCAPADCSSSHLRRGFHFNNQKILRCPSADQTLDFRDRGSTVDPMKNMSRKQNLL